MPFIAQYLLKLSISLSVVYLFYVLVLQRLTFYNLNRWYLLGYSLLSFFIPFVNISPVLERNELTGNTVVMLIPVMGNAAAPAVTGRLDGWSVSLFLLLAGIAIMLTRLLIQYLSFLRIRKSALLISDESVKIYQVDRYIMPFSFGRSIFINQHQHTEDELKEIIRHEFIHVKQRHTVDILFGEVLSMLNWYNPFTWLIRHSIRQNLEFIADHQVLKTGLDRKQYQYLLLKVVGTPAFAIANQFNLSSLKKRIAMMNKMRSAKVHLIKFLFVLPLVTVLLLAFRQAAIKNQPDDLLAVNALPDDSFRVMDMAVLADANTPAPLIHKKTPDTMPAVKQVTVIGYGKDTSRPILIDASLNGPGNPYTFRFRGVAAGGTPPLIIIDGVRKDDTDGALRNVNPEKIEKVEVLKDASAEALYGAQGKYGVLLITTKKEFKAEPVAPVTRDTVQFRGTIRFRNNVEDRNTGLESFSGIFIVDGVKCDSLAVRNIKPEDIQRIDVLKGNAAEALYGSKGAQGVIIITTKKKDQRITGTVDPASGPRHFVTTAEGSGSLREEALRDHILYVGVENRLFIDFKGVKPGELKVSMSGDAPGFGLSIDYKKGIATIKPANPGKAELVISRRKPDGSEEVLQKQVYDIKLLPPPITFVSDRSPGRPPVQEEGKPIVIDASGRIDNKPSY